MPYNMKIDAYRDYIQQNRQFWEDFSPAKDELEDKTILVDLLVDFPPYALGNLIVAKYLQKKTNARIAAIIVNPESHRRLRDLISSFGVDEVLYVDYFGKTPNKLDPGYVEALENEKDPEQLRKKILDYSIDGLKVGDLVYDSYLKLMGSPTITEYNKQLQHLLNVAVCYYDVYSKIFSTRKVVATVQAHTVYLYYGMLAYVAIKNGVPVFGRKPAASPTVIRKYTRMDELGSVEKGFRKEDFYHIWDNCKEKAIGYAREFLEKRFEGKRLPGSSPTIGDAYKPDRQKYDFDRLVSELGLDRNKPIVFLLCHSFSDAPHADKEMIHNDYFEWLEDTLEIVKTIQEVNWVVKAHPSYIHYNKVNFAEQATLKLNRDYPHISFVPDHFHSQSMLENAHAVVTVRGHAALEFPAMGIPAITTGKAPYTSMGFTVDAKDREEYVEILKNIKNIQSLTRDQIEKALVCCYCYFYYSYVKCSFLPYVENGFWRPFDSAKFWSEALAAIQQNTVLNDPLYHNFNVQLQMNLPYIVKFDERPYAIAC